jgi:hypothetical protein
MSNNNNIVIKQINNSNKLNVHNILNNIHNVSNDVYMCNNSNNITNNIIDDISNDVSNNIIDNISNNTIGNISNDVNISNGVSINLNIHNISDDVRNDVHNDLYDDLSDKLSKNIIKYKFFDNLSLKKNLIVYNTLNNDNLIVKKSFLIKDIIPYLNKLDNNKLNNKLNNISNEKKKKLENISNEKNKKSENKSNKNNKLENKINNNKIKNKSNNTILNEKNKKKYKLIPSKYGDNIFYSKNIYNYLLFDRVALYSTTSYKVAEIISKLVLKFVNFNHNLVMTDATAGIGGNTISFAKIFKKINIVEMDEVRYYLLLINIGNYNILDRVILYNNNYLNIFHKLKQDIVFMDPPWGGPLYKGYKYINLKLSNVPLYTLCNKLITSYIVLKVPLNFNFNKFFTNIIYNQFKVVKLKKMAIIMIQTLQ